MRLLDRILASGFGVGMNIDEIDNIQNTLRDSQLIIIDNVADYAFNECLDNFFVASSFPCVMLPFELCFFEFRIPKIGRNLTGCQEVGALFIMQPPGKLRTVHPETFDQPGVQHELTSYYFVRNLGSNKVILMAEFVLPVGADGQIISPKDDRIYGFTNLFTPNLSKEKEQHHLKFIHQLSSCPMLLALSFMHCRNVTMKEESPPAKLSKAHNKKRGRPLLRYHVLEINHMKSVLEKQGGASTNGLKKALHICRGHFSEYGSNGKGLLFGKHSGRYWIPAHTRGSTKEGRVIKDYKVK